MERKAVRGNVDEEVGKGWIWDVASRVGEEIGLDLDSRGGIQMHALGEMAYGAWSKATLMLFPRLACQKEDVYPDYGWEVTFQVRKGPAKQTG